MFVFNVPIASLVGYTGGNLCSVDVSCQLTGGGTVTTTFFGPSGNDTAAFGSLTMASTPEPSSLALLGSAILGGAGALRRRLARR